ncbi:MAG TPA: carboxymuconolactone decarboxylase family protein [Thermodesulfobacteriota bacterium]|jgi:AhpD family alkylhydroperoxidase|nr:carboxymuconolactone decarboxylase family protein [Thermodesulfobacteriota bacterium]
MTEYLFKKDISQDIGFLKKINPDLHQAWMDFHNSVFKDGALSRKEKEIIALAGAHITRCPYCIRGRVTTAKKTGATDEEIVEAIYVAMRFAMGAPYAYSSIAFEAADSIEKGIPLTEGHFFKKDITHEINHFREASGDLSRPFMEFHKRVFADGALSQKMKRGIIGLACAHMTRCPYCIRGCVKDAITFGVTKAQMAEAINVAMVMAAGACYAHTGIAMDTLASINAKEEERAKKAVDK